MITQTLTLFFVLLQIVAHVSTSNIHYNECSSNGEVIRCAGTTWESNGTTVAGGNGGGNALNQLNGSYAVFVDSDDTLFITDYYNHRVVKWNRNASNGTLLAGGQCGQIDQGQLCFPTAMAFDKNGTMFVTVEDDRNGGVISWKKGATSGETLIIANTSFYGIALDAEEKYLYVGHHLEHRVIKYTKDGIFVRVVAGGNGNGSALNQLNCPRGVAVDKNGSVYVSDSSNHRVVKWALNATEGIIVAGGNGNGSQTDQLTIPNGIIVDEKETIFVADNENHRVMLISAGTLNGTIIAGGNGAGNASNQFANVDGLAFDRQGNLYASDWGNYRVQMFAMEKTPSTTTTTTTTTTTISISTATTKSSTTTTTSSTGNKAILMITIQCGLIFLMTIVF